MRRRNFIQSLAGLGLLAHCQMFSSCREDTGHQLDILILGGTYFVGPAIIKAALKNNHQVTLFNRGVTNPGLFPDLPHIEGDRSLGPDAYRNLQNKNWDVIIDVWPEESMLVKEATEALHDHTKHYVFISSIAVYNNFQEVGLHENSPVVDLNLSREEWSYPEEKLQAEEYVRTQFPDNHSILRPGPITGWRDPAVDLLYWCLKLNGDDAILAPGSGMDPIQFIDVNDVGKIAVLAAENHLPGIFNCTGPKTDPLLWKDFLAIAKQHFNSPAELHWASEDFLRANEVFSFTDLPLWAPLSEDRGFMQISNKKLIESGFEFTPVQQTLADCLSWYEQNKEKELNFGTKETGVGLERSRELRLIEDLLQSQSDSG